MSYAIATLVLCGFIIGLFGLTIWEIFLLSGLIALAGIATALYSPLPLLQKLLYIYGAIAAVQMGYSAGIGLLIWRSSKAGRDRLRVLVAEDEEIVAMQIEREVTDSGHISIGAVKSGPEAVRAALARCPDVVIMDIRLANGTDGVAAAAEIRKKLGTPPVFVTAHADPRTRARALAVEPLAFLTKPYDPRQLREALALGCKAA